jgi:hypothetical protein
MSCRPVLSPRAEWAPASSGLLSEPSIIVAWHPPLADRPVTGGARVWYAEVDRTYMNYPMKFFKAQEVVVDVGGKSEIVLDPYTTNHAASFAIKVCVLYSSACIGADCVLEIKEL